MRFTGDGEVGGGLGVLDTLGIRARGLTGDVLVWLGGCFFGHGGCFDVRVSQWRRAWWESRGARVCSATNTRFQGPERDEALVSPLR